MRILFVHQNFPAQFFHLAGALQARGHDVKAFTSNSNTQPIKQFTWRYKFLPRDYTPGSIGLAGAIAQDLDRGEIVAAAAAQLKARNAYVPDIIVGHIGWGETLYLKHVWPDARLVLYAEWFHRPYGQDSGFDPEFEKPAPRVSNWIATRQMPELLALDIADCAIAPTNWQASTFPERYRDKISVIHDGVDTERICPDGEATVQLPGCPLVFRAGEEIITFVNRNLEPFRGYHTLMRALPKVLAARPNAHVVIVGEDSTGYGTPPPEGSTWKQIYLDEVNDRLDLSRVHFTGNILYPTLVDLLRVSRVHAYLTYPFVLSWSMLEAMSAGALVVGSRTPPVEEVIKDGVNGRLIGFFDVDAWSDILIDALANPEKFVPLRRAGRDTILRTYDLKTKCLPRLLALVEGA